MERVLQLGGEQTIIYNLSVLKFAWKIQVMGSLLVDELAYGWSIDLKQSSRNHNGWSMDLKQSTRSHSALPPN